MNKKIITIGAIALLVVSTVLSVLSYTNQKKTAFFDYNTVYNNCALKIKLEKDLQQVASSRKSELDSLQLELSFLSEKVKANTATALEASNFEDMKNRFLTFQDQYEQENIRLKETYFTQIRKEINDKAKLYAEQQGFDYFFSATGDGAMMYAAPSEDVTKEFQAYLDGK